MRYERALRQAEKTGRTQEECEDIAQYAVDMECSAKQAEKDLIKDGILQYYPIIDMRYR